MSHVKERVKLLTEVPEMIDFLAKDTIERDLSAMYTKGIDAGIAREILTTTLPKLKALTSFTANSIEEVLRPLAEEKGLKPGPVFGVFRIAVTGKKITPPLFESMVALGQEITVRRIEETIRAL